MFSCFYLRSSDVIRRSRGMMVRVGALHSDGPGIDSTLRHFYYFDRYFSIIHLISVISTQECPLHLHPSSLKMSSFARALV